MLNSISESESYVNLVFLFFLRFDFYFFLASLSASILDGASRLYDPEYLMKARDKNVIHFFLIWVKLYYTINTGGLH